MACVKRKLMRGVSVPLVQNELALCRHRKKLPEYPATNNSDTADYCVDGSEVTVRV